jgi:type II secretory pathway component PulJ
MNPRLAHRGRGFLMIQMLITITLIAAFLIVADHVFRLSLQTTAKVNQQHETLLRLERALVALRADVWQAGAGVRTPAPSRLSIGDRIEWQVDADGQLTRKEKSGHLQSFGLLPLAFDARAPLVSVSINRREVALLRQALTNGGGR